jgi:hypothetical protein
MPAACPSRGRRAERLQRDAHAAGGRAGDAGQHVDRDRERDQRVARRDAEHRVADQCEAASEAITAPKPTCDAVLKTGSTDALAPASSVGVAGGASQRDQQQDRAASARR